MVVMVYAGLAAVLSPAASANYDNCPNGYLCLYQHANGTGSKAILTGHAGYAWNFSNVYFLNGVNANDQVSSVFNRTSWCAVFYRNYDLQYWDTSWVGRGQRRDYGWGAVESRFNDILSSVQLVAC